MISGHCSADGDCLDHDNCPLPLSCQCPRHLSDGNLAADRAALTDIAPIRGPVLPPKAEPVVDQLPPARAGGMAERYLGTALDGTRGVAGPLLLVEDDVVIEPFPPGVFSLGDIDPTKEQPMPKATAPSVTCHICDHVAKSSQGLAVHKARKHGIRGTSRLPGAAAERRTRTPRATAAPSTPPTPEPDLLPDGIITSPVANPTIVPIEILDQHGDRMGQVVILLERGIFDLTSIDRNRMFALVDAVRDGTY